MVGMTNGTLPLRCLASLLGQSPAHREQRLARQQGMSRTHVVPDGEGRGAEVFTERGCRDVEQRSAVGAAVRRFRVLVHADRADLDEVVDQLLTGAGPRTIGAEITGPVTGTRSSIAGRW